MPRNKQPYKSLECFICHRPFARKMFNLRRHLALHGPSLFISQCATCGKTFQNKGNYKTHWLRKHVGKRSKTIPDPVEISARATRKTRIIIAHITIAHITIILQS